MKVRLRSGSLLCGMLLLTAVSAGGATGLPPGWEGVPAAVAALNDPGERVVLISARFLGTPYVAETLGGGPGQGESLTVRFDAVDCFTLLDYVEALRRSAAPEEFGSRLSEVRYRDGRIAWEARRHFFTDWAAAPGGQLVDVTAEVGGQRTRRVVKELNRREDGSLHLPGVAVRQRPVAFIPAAALAPDLLDRLRPGDYLGIYSPVAGLDVSHVGIVVREGETLRLRHASARPSERKVIDSDLIGYLDGKPGIVVLRPPATARP